MKVRWKKRYKAIIEKGHKIHGHKIWHPTGHFVTTSKNNFLGNKFSKVHHSFQRRTRTRTVRLCFWNGQCVLRFIERRISQTCLSIGMLKKSASSIHSKMVLLVLIGTKALLRDTLTWLWENRSQPPLLEQEALISPKSY